MECLQKGNTVFNNKQYSAMNAHDLNFDENNPRNSNLNSHSNMQSLFSRNCQIFRNKHTKDSTENVKEINKNEIFFDSSIKDDIFNKKSDKNIQNNSESQERLCNEDKNHNINVPLKTHLEDLKITHKEKLSKSSDTSNPLDTKHYPFIKSPDVHKHYDRGSFLENISPLQNCDEDIDVDQTSTVTNNMDRDNDDMELSEPPHHARRPMNAFLIFCKRHRTVDKNKYPHLENRAVTKILGEWWAALETEEKACYTDLAKQYKNAFFSANPNFKWYKLPAPPLRTLHTRPTNVVKVQPIKKSPEFAEETQSQETLFTPGKLADETQLGSITSLINFDNQHSTVSKSLSTCISNTDSMKETDVDSFNDNWLSPPVTAVISSQPLKPFKKRMVHQNKDNKNVVRSIFSTNQEKFFDNRSLTDQAFKNFAEDNYSSILQNTSDKSSGEEDYNCYTIEKEMSVNNNTDSNVTKQELIDKVVDHICYTSNDNETDSKECNTCLQIKEDKINEQRTSVRSCKGLRYAKFMAEGKLLVNKRSKKQHSSTVKTQKASIVPPEQNNQVPRKDSIELNETIKKLSERTKLSSKMTVFSDFETERKNTNSDVSEEHFRKMFRAADFNLDAKIEALPSLSLEKFQQKKKESKKRKFFRSKIHDVSDRKKMHSEAELKHVSDNNNITLIGSRKRKPRKQSITRLDPHSDNKFSSLSEPDVDLFGLATLAEVAAKKAKIDQQ